MTSTTVPISTVPRPLTLAIGPRPTIPIPPRLTTVPVTVPKPLMPPVSIPVPLVSRPLISPALIPAQITRPLTPPVPRPPVAVPRPLSPPIPVPKPTVLPIPVPKPTVLPVTVPKPISTQPTVLIPKPITKPMILPVTVPKPVSTQAVVSIPKQGTLPILKPASPKMTSTIQVPKAQTIVFTPENINEDTIIEYANSLDKTNFEGLLQFLSDAYHNDEGLVSDRIFDELQDIYEAKYEPYTVVGAEPTGEMVDLPYYLGSLRKVKEEAELTRWLQQHSGPYIIEDKIDGVTLLDYNANGRTTLLTRGGGVRGKDVSHLLQYINLPNTTNSVRGELVMTKETFARVGAGFKNARNLVSGIAGSKKQFNPILARELSFYAYRIVNKAMTAEEDINELLRLGFLVPNAVAAPYLTKEILEDYYRQRKEQAPYEMDGLVIYQNQPGEYPIGEAPRHVVAFKTGSETAVTTVTRVVWRASKDRLLKPRVFYEVKHLSGADLEKASGYNARFIVDHNIGPGAEILLTRSGDTIPKILSVIKPAPNGPDLPDPNVFGNYFWNSNQVELFISEDSPEVMVGKMKHFLTTIGVKKFGRNRIMLLVDAGIRNIDDLLAVTPEELEQIDGIGPDLSNQLVTDIHEKITNISLPRIADASGIFPGVGERRFEMITDVYPNFLDLVSQFGDNELAIADYIRGVKGFNKLADVIAAKLPLFMEWIHRHPEITIAQPRLVPIPSANVPPLKPGLTMNPSASTVPIQLQIGGSPSTQSNRLVGTTSVFSGFRDKQLEDRIKARGGKVTTSVSRNTTFLILKDLSPESMKGKAEKAQQLGAQLISRDQFEREYL
jgi:DNA ligase (NAD+)